MKCVSLLLAFGFALVLFSSGPLSRAGDAPKPVSEDFGYDYFNGKSNRIARIYNVTPISVQVIYEGDKGGRNIPRTELPPELKVKYPYNADEAAEFIKNRAVEVSARNAAQRSAWEQKVLELKASLDVLKKQITDNDHAIHTLTLQIRADKHNKDLKEKKADLLVQQDDMLKRRTTLQDKLAEAQKMVDKLP